jgi:ketosteroid isomerase-like protein
MDIADARRAELRSLFSRLITAFGEKDFENFATFLTEETVFDWPYLPLKSFPKSMVGASAFIEAAKVGMADCDGYHHQVETFYDQADPDTLIVEYFSNTTLASGKAYGNHYLGILRFAGSKVVYWREYINPLPVLEAYGLDFENKAAA